MVDELLPRPDEAAKRLGRAMTAIAEKVASECVNVPAELRERNQWVCWRFAPSADAPDKLKKPPFDPGTGRPASVTDARTWGAFELAVASSADMDGVGFVLTSADPYAVLDLDHCRNAATGVLADWAAEIVREVDSYTEVSPSGEGLHIWTRAVLPQGRRRVGPVEVYDSGRYLTVTGQHLDGTRATIEDRQDTLAALHRRLFAQDALHHAERAEDRAQLSDDELVRRAGQAANAEKFTALYGGDSSSSPSQSEADAALCCMLAYRTRDSLQIDRLFRSSGLMRAKWDERHANDGRTYGQITVANAIEHVAKLGAAPTAPAGWRTAAELAWATPERVDWIVEGLLAVGAVTDLSAKVKVGKTTFVAAAIAAVLQGRPFIGQATRRVPVLYLSEERTPSFRQLLERVGLSEEQDLHVLLRQDARGQRWPDTVADAVRLAGECAAGLLVVDTLPDWAEFGGDAENSAGAALAAIRPLHAAAAAGLAVLFLRHDRKSGGELGDSGRGSSAIAGAADILFSLRYATTNGHPNRRLLTGQGRFDAVVRHRLLELRDGHYESLGENTDVEFGETKQLVLGLLPKHGDDTPLTEAELLDQLEGKVSRGRLRRVLEVLTGGGLAKKEMGYGKRRTALGYSRTDPDQLLGSGA